MPAKMYNYGHFEVTFADGSVGWYEAGWGPMMSETAFFVKDVIGPKGSVSIVMAENSQGVKSDDINAHTKTNQILWHHADMSKPDERIDMSTHTKTNQILYHPAELAADGTFVKGDERITTADEPGHDDLCEREQRFLMRAIDEDLDLGDHMDDAVKSLRIVLAADRSVRTGEVVAL